MAAKQNVSVTYQEFLNELEKELSYLKEGGTSYRVETAELSLMVTKEVKTVEPFIDRETAFKVVSNLLPNTDLDRLKDVSKMLNVIWGSLHLEANLSKEIKEKLEKEAKKNTTF